MDKKQKIDAIYEAMADKTLSYGCIIKTSDGIMRTSGCCEKYEKVGGYTIIGHPVCIGDVIEYIRLNNIWDINPITDEWDYPRLPIDEQSDDAISFVYNLIKK